MRGLRCFAAMALTASLLTLTGAKKPGSIPPRLIFGPVTHAFERCEPASSPGAPDIHPNVGVIRIVLPKHLDLSNLSRAVKLADTPFDDTATEDATKDNAGVPNNNPHAVPGMKVEPFHIYLKKTSFPNGSFILVRVIIQRGSEYTFYDEPNARGIHGVGWSDNPTDASTGLPVLCGNRRIITSVETSGMSPRQVASFYIRRGALAKAFEGSINIGLKPNEAPETPIFIDPKVHNDG